MSAVTLVLPYPISANRYWRTVVPRGGRRAMTFVSPEAVDYKKQVIAIAKQSGIDQPIHGRVSVEYTLYPKRPLDWAKRARKSVDWDDDVMCIDLDNAQKVLFDSLKNVVFDDDKWVRKITAERAEPDGEARVVVVIRSIKTAVTAQPQLI